MPTLGRLAIVCILASTLALLAVQAAGADDPAATLTGEEMLVQD